MSKVAEQKALMLQRRLDVAEMMRRRIPQEEMAKKLGVNRGTISRDVKALVQEWEKQVQTKAGYLRARELQELDHLEGVAQLNMENALQLRYDLERAAKAQHRKVDSKEWEKFDRSVRAWHGQRIRVKERRAKLLNLDVQEPDRAPVVNVPISFIQVASPPPAPALESGNGHPVIEGEVVGGSD